MERIKRAVCLALCFVMVLGILPIHAFAVDSDAPLAEPQAEAGEVIADAAEPLAQGDEISPMAEATNSGTGSLVGGSIYTLDTNGVTANKDYLILNTSNSGTGYALTNNNGSAGRTQVTISNNTITVEDDASIAWQFSGSSSGTVGNKGSYLNPGNGSLSLNDNGTTLTISSQDNGAYKLYRSEQSDWWTNYYYVRYNNNNWTGGVAYWDISNVGSVYLYEKTSSSEGGSVTFTVTPASVSLAPEATQALTGSVLVNGQRVNLSSCTIEWSTGNRNIATVSNGTVTAVANGSTTITAKLTAVNGTQVANGGITVTIPVTVAPKTIVEGSEKLTGNDPVTTTVGVAPDFSKIKLTVTYSDGTTGVITADNGLVIEGYDVSKPGFSYATISYNGKEHGQVRVIVSGNPFAGLDEATEYPVYPADGAVRIDKTGTELDLEDTGVVRVELDVAGVSVKSAVDVILVTDLSNSMAWEAGGRTDATTHEDTKLYSLQNSVSEFANIFLANDSDGNPTRNTMSLVTFGGYDADHTNKVYTKLADPTQTLVLGSNSAETIRTTIGNIRVIADDYLNIGASDNGYWLSFDGGTTYGENYGNTNYDHAFMQTAEAIADLKADYQAKNGTSYDASGRQIYVVFMTDGAPSNYDGVYYNYKTGDRADVNCTWVNANGQEVTYTMGNNRNVYGQADWYKYIAGSAYTNGTITGNPLYWADQVYNTPGVADIFNVGFDLDNGGFSSMVFTEASGCPLDKVLEKMVTGKTLEVFSADNEAALTEIYSKLATQIRYAGTLAQVNDVVDSQFTLQMDNITGSVTGNGGTTCNLAEAGISTEITVTAYDLWTKAETDDLSKIGTRKGTSTVLETVTFSADGLTATSSEKGDDENILSVHDDGTVVIDAEYFTYTKTPEGLETFDWYIGNITDKEVALSYLAYLKGSLEGERAKGLYYTNEKATLDYVDINGKHATQTFPIPAVAWGGASTAYEFYLVNEKGEPCDRAGNPIPFANRIIITGPYFEELYLNQSGEYVSKEIVAAKVLPAGYVLYDDTAKYSVQTGSGSHEGKLEISDPAGNKAQTTIKVSATEPSYIQSRVAFGVMYNVIPEEAEFVLAPDVIVIDYGKAITVNVADNNDVPASVTAKLVGFSKYFENFDDSTKAVVNTSIPEYDTDFGIFTIENAVDGIVRYTPVNFVNAPDQIFAIFEITEGGDPYYMVNRLTVIPATIVYYETDFAEGVFTYQDTWSTMTDNIEADGPQDDGRLGQGHYGYDSTYENDAVYSNGSSLFAEGKGVEDTTTSFRFVGTGFDLISRTGKDQGLIKVQVFSESDSKTPVKSISVLNRSESNLELHQIPVISINDLPYGSYNVKIGVEASYENNTGIPAFDALEHDNDFYFDAIRIYDPALGNEIAEDAYDFDGEANAQVSEVRALLLAAKTFNALNGETNGVVFVDRNKNVEIGDAPYDTVAEDYANIGPNNEVYLKPGQAIAFKITANSIPASVDIGAKSIVPNTNANLTVTVKTSTSDNGIEAVNKPLSSATAQYINLLTANGVASKFYGSGAYVVIQNTGAENSILSITDIKVAYSTINAASLASVNSGVQLMSYDPYAVRITVGPDALEVMDSVFNPVEEEEICAAQILNASVKANGSKKNTKYTFTVVTTQQTSVVTVNEGGKQLMPGKITYKDNKKTGTRVWTIVINNGASNRFAAFELTAFAVDGSEGNTVSVSKPR